MKTYTDYTGKMYELVENSDYQNGKECHGCTFNPLNKFSIDAVKKCPMVEQGGCVVCSSYNNDGKNMVMKEIKPETENNTTPMIEIEKAEMGNYSTDAGFIADIFRSALNAYKENIIVNTDNLPGNDHIVEFALFTVNGNGDRIRIPVTIDFFKLINQ